MKIFIFGGTTEGRILAGELSGKGHDVTVSVATDVGSECLGEIPVRVLTGRLDKEAMSGCISEAEIVLDATHPFAVEATENIRAACEERDIRYVRVRRSGEDRTEDEGAVFVKDHKEAAQFLKEKEGKILLTVGVKNLGEYAGIPAKRIIARVLPVVESIAGCEKNGIAHSNIIAMQGPFSEELNEAIIRQYDIRYMVTKESGSTGGYPEKLRACGRTGVVPVVIKAPEEEGMSVEEVLEMLNG